MKKTLSLIALLGLYTSAIAQSLQTFTIRGVSFKMVYVQGGMFSMGATKEQGSDTYEDEKPAHQVTVSSFSIGQTEVTQELWWVVMGTNPSDFKGAKRPVENVSWNDCQMFIRKLNQLTGKNFRLPTEAEWEYAARGGNKCQNYKYSGNNNINYVAWYDGVFDESEYYDCTHTTVGKKYPNELGLFDMSGNVYEWCQDFYESSYYSHSPLTNPKGPNFGYDHVYRGGGWCSISRECRVAYRNRSNAAFRINYLGLRLAL